MITSSWVIGETIGNFKVADRLGRGGMGEVFLAHQTSVGTRVAVKILRPEVSADQEYVSRFFNEARAVERIQHAGIVKIFDCGYTTGGQAYLIMEFLEGETLAARLQRVGRLGLAEIGDIGRQIASVLAATHGAGITHRDLKPDNIYLVPDRELARGERVKILDFGIAKLTDTIASSSPRTIGTMGTPAYMAPEQWGDASKVDRRADVYSFGCVAFEMACGRPPFLVTTIAEACAKHLHELPPRARTIVPDLPQPLDDLLARLLEKSPDARPQSMQEVARVFEAIGDGRTSVALPTAPLPIALAQTVGTLPPATPPPGPPQVSMLAAPPRRSKKPLLAIAGLAVIAAAGAAGYVAMSHEEDKPARKHRSAAVEPGDAAPRPIDKTPEIVIAPPDAAPVAEPPGDAAAAVAVQHPPPAGKPTIDGKAVDAAFAKVQPQLDACYDRELGVNPELRGTVTAKLTVELDGYPTQVSAAGVDKKLDDCVADVVRTLKFPAPRGGSIPLERPIEFDDQKPAPAPAEGSTQPWLGPVMIRSGLGRIRGAALACGPRNDMRGRISVHVEVAADGHVRNAQVIGDYDGTPGGDCVIAAVKKARFPKTQKGGTFTRFFLMR